MRAAVLLIKAAEEWRRQHEDQLPSSRAERNEFKALISSWQQHVDDVAIEVCGYPLVARIDTGCQMLYVKLTLSSTGGQL